MCFMLSGAAGLVYETAWTHQLALVFGATELAVAAVLAAYMGGLAAGAAVACRLVDRLRRPLLAYGLLELAVAGGALLVPGGLQAASRLQTSLLGGAELSAESLSLGSALFFLLAAFVILAIPTGCMGATLPLLVRAVVRHEREVGPRVAVLYSANTTGAAAGALLAAYTLLPALGLDATVLAGVLLNVAALFIAVALATTTAAAPEHQPGTDGEGARFTDVWILPVIAVSGFVSLSCEVLWTRLLSHLLGGSIFAFSSMLASFLIGLGVGSGLAARTATTRDRALRGFVAAQIGIGCSTVLSFLVVDLVPELFSCPGGGSSLLRGLPIAAGLLLPTTLFIGATFPCAVRILARHATHAGSASARVVVWSTMGAITGAVVTGFLLLPALRLAGSMTAVAVIAFALAAVAALVSRPRMVLAAAASIAAIAGLLVAGLPTPWRVLRTSPLTGRVDGGRIAYYGVGRSSTVIVLEQGEQLRLTTNGLPEASIELRGARPGKFALSRWLSLLPSAVRPDGRTMAIVGLGSGLMLEAVPPRIEEIHVVELEPEVVKANRTLAPLRRTDPLANPRLTLHLNDARSALRLSEVRFDVVVSQPSHPWTSGSSYLFTREFFQLVSDHLETGGVFVQWIGLEHVDSGLMRSLLATLLEAFEHVEVYRPPPGGALLLVASRQPQHPEITIERSLAAAPEQWLETGVRSPVDVEVARLLDAEGARVVAANAPPITDGRNLLMTGSPRILASPLADDQLETELADLDPLRRRMHGSESLHVIRRLLSTGSVARAGRLVPQIADSGDRQTASALLQFATGDHALGEQNLWSLVVAGRIDDEVLSALMLSRRRELTGPTPPAAIVRLLGVDATAALVYEGWRLVATARTDRLRDLDLRLAAVDSTHPLFSAATGLRVRWRQSTGDPADAREAIRLLDLEMTFRPPSVQQLLHRARLAVQAGDAYAVLASLLELEPVLQRGLLERQILAEAIDILDVAPFPEEVEPKAARLRQEMLDALSPGP